MATLFSAVPTAFTNFTDGSPITTNIQTGESVVYSGTAGPAGAGAIIVTSTAGTSATAQEVGVRSSVAGGGGRSLKWTLMVPSSGVLNGPSLTNFIWSSSGSSNYGATLGQVGITQARTQSGTTGVSGNYRLFLQTPQDSYATLYYGGTSLVRGVFYTLELRLSNDQIILYVTDPTSGIQDAQCYVRGATGSSFSGLQFGTITYGKVNNAVSTAYGYVGSLNFSQVGMYSLPTPTQATTPAAVFADLWAGKKARDLRHDGAIVRHMGYAPGSTGDGGYGYGSTGGSDIVSEGQAYGAFSAVQAGDQVSANLIFNFAYTTLCRRNAAIATAQNNGTIAGGTTTFAPNLMGFKYQDDLNSFWDGMPAADAENDMMRAYFLAHGRFGSSGLTPGATGESASINYLQRGINIARDLKATTFTAGTDGLGSSVQFQSADTINGLNELSPSYLDPWAFRLAAQYDTLNTAFWNQAVSGTYTVLNAVAGVLDSYSGPTEWAKLTAASGGSYVADPLRTTQNGTGYGYNAFRAIHRVNYDYYFYNESRANNYLTTGFRNFSTTEYTNRGLFAMEKANDGTPFTTANGGSATAAYEKTANTYGQYVTQKLNTPTSIAAGIKSSKLNWSTLYQPSENGSFIQDAPGGLDSYYMDYWGMFSYAMDNGTMTNYGQGSVVTRPKNVTIDALINNTVVSTRSLSVSLDSLIKKTVRSAVTIDALINSVSPTRSLLNTIDSLIKKTVISTVTIDAVINALPGGSQVSVHTISSMGMNKAALISFCQKTTSNLDSDSALLFAIFLNLSQRDVESEFPDHPGLHASDQFALVPGIDLSYAFAPDFRKEINIRIASPVQLSHQLKFVEYIDFRNNITDLSVAVPGIPYWWYWAPENPLQIHFYRVPDQQYLVQYDYVRYAPDMISDTDYPFFDRMYHQILCYRTLFYYYNSDGVARPTKGAQWDDVYRAGLFSLKEDYQRRQIPTSAIQYGTGVNEGYSSGWIR